MFIKPKELDFVSDLKIKNICPKVMEIINEHVNQELFNIWDNIAECESPIEQIFCIHFNWKIYNNSVIENLKKIGYVIDDIGKQYEIGNYRIDFLFSIKNIQTGKYKNFIVELDGHDFHEKTKEQAKRDKEKDRFLISEGYTVIRFTGSEIYNNSFEKINEFLDIVYKECER